MPRRDNYGRILPTHRWQGVSRPRRWWRAWRWWLFAAVLIGAVVLIDAWWQVPPAEPKGTPVRVALEFHRCGKGRGPNCVVDGDTFIMTARHIRITGIDAPEIGAKARCPRESELAEAAADELLRLLNQGPFVMQPPQDGLRDEYGRELMIVTRAQADGAKQDIAQALVAAGRVRPYLHGAREPWC
jgi:endonuclease YncB( thermonuclease family)